MKLDDYDCSAPINLKIDGYSAEAIAYTSKLAFEAVLPWSLQRSIRG